MDFEVIEIIQSVEERKKLYSSMYTKYGSEENDFLTMWSSYLADRAPTTEFSGLHALWKLSKTQCFKYDLSFSSSFHVVVNRVDYSTLAAYVEIIDGEETARFNLPQELRAPLTELYITKEQNNDRQFAFIVAQCLDHLRIFYKYLWWPWDADIPDSKIWFSKHLNHRLKLYEDLTSGNYSESITKKIKTLIEKGKLFYDLYLKETESIVQDDEVNCETKRKIVKYVKNIELIKESLKSITINSCLSSGLNCESQNCKVNSGEALLVMNGLKLEKMIKCAHEIAESYPSVKLRRVSDRLENALNSFENNDTIFLSLDEHSLSGECLNTNVTIRGLAQEGSVIRGESSFWYLLKTTSDNVNLHNLTIRSGENLVQIYVKEGITCIESVTTMSSSECQKAIIVEEKATLVANGCRFVDFDTAIICLPGSAVQLSDCVFQRNFVSIKVVGDAQLCLDNVTAEQCGKAFIQYEGDVSSNEYRSLEELSNIAVVSIESVRIDDEKSAVQFV